MNELQALWIIQLCWRHCYNWLYRWTVVDLDLRPRNEESMNVNKLVNNLEKIIRVNSPTILTAIGVSGTLTTAYLAGKASIRAARVIDNEQERLNRIEKGVTLGKKEKFKLVWKLYIPTAVSGALTIGCIISGTRIGTKRTAAAYSLLTVSEKAFGEYRDKVVEQIGAKKEQTVRDEIVKDRVTNNPPGVIIIGSGDVLCLEMHTGRYFNSDMETLRKAVNTINAKIIQQMDANLSEFYYLVGLPNTSYSFMSGWNSDKLLELHFSTTLSEDGRPCIAFDYNYVIPF
jgi:Family of unknown function (DUF6353)